MKDLCQSLFGVAGEALVDSNAGCCAKFHTVVGGIAGLLRCQRLLTVLSKAAQAAVRMVEAIASLIEES